MDKYQEYLMNRVYFGYTVGGSLAVDGKALGYFMRTEGFTLVQNKDITIEGYGIAVHGSVIEKAYAVKGKRKFLFKAWDGERRNPELEYLYLPIDFENRMDSIVLVFKNELADDLTVPLNYLPADKEAYYAEKEQERIRALLDHAHISVATGENLANIYFQPCIDDVSVTEVYLFKDGYRIMTYRAEGERCFIAITDLAYGVYEFSLAQYDKSGSKLVESPKTSFTVRRYSPSC